MTRVETGFAGTSRFEKVLYVVVRSMVGGFMQLYTRMKIEGKDHLPVDGADEHFLAP